MSVSKYNVTNQHMTAYWKKDKDMPLLLNIRLLLSFRIVKLIFCYSLRHFTMTNQLLNCQSYINCNNWDPRSVVAEDVRLFGIYALWLEIGRWCFEKRYISSNHREPLMKRTAADLNPRIKCNWITLIEELGGMWKNKSEDTYVTWFPLQ